MKREEKKIKIMEDIITSTMSMLKNRAWHTLKAEEICSHANVSKRTFYTYFQSLDTLYLSLVKKAFIMRNELLSQATNVNDDIKTLLLSMARSLMKFSFDHEIEGLLVHQYDERRYIDKYPRWVLEISDIANSYELTQIFKLKGVDTQVYSPALALFLWSSVTGWIDLIQNKAKWITHYYQIPIDVLFEEHLAIMKKFLEEL